MNKTKYRIFERIMLAVAVVLEIVITFSLVLQTYICIRTKFSFQYKTKRSVSNESYKNSIKAQRYIG